MRVFVALAILCLSSADARVSLINSEILQAPDLLPSNEASFQCVTNCKVYVNLKSEKLVVTQMGNVITNFKNIFGQTDYVSEGVILTPGKYKIENQGETNPEFVFYIADTTDPIVSQTPVYVLPYSRGFVMNGHYRMSTILTSYDAVQFSEFDGIFPDGYPRIYATGYDAVNSTECIPLYQARSQSNAQLSYLDMSAAIFTVDFGFDGKHSVTALNADLAYSQRAGSSTVYTSPGFSGCVYNDAPNYYSSSILNQGGGDFNVNADRLDMRIFYNGITYADQLNLRVNEFEIELHDSQYVAKNESVIGPWLNVKLSWAHVSNRSSFAMQFDYAPFPPTIASSTTPATTHSQTTTPPTTTSLQPAKDSYCDCTVDKFGMPSGWKSTEIWLDIVIVVDTSEAMGQSSLDDATSLVDSLIGDGDYDVLITDPRAAFYTRIGVIAAASKTEVLYNLNMTKEDSVSDKVQLSKGVKEMDVELAFESALEMFAQGNNPERANTRQIIYYLTDSDVGANTALFDQFKLQGAIIVEQFAKNGETTKNLDQLASFGYYFKTNGRSPIPLLCKANCFCQPDRTAFAGSSTDPAVIAAGGCFHAPSTGLQFNKAVKQCSNNRDGLLASVHDQHKAAFLNELVTNATSDNYYFWIGYSKGDDGQWIWEDNSSDHYTNWDVNEPSTAAVAKCAYVDQSQAKLPWGAGNCQIVFPYVCEYTPCAVGYKDC